MSFTDDDIRRCKRLLKSEGAYQRHVLNNHEVEALIARLEAAEKVCEAIQSDNENPDEVTIDALLVWRGAAGK